MANKRSEQEAPQQPSFEEAIEQLDQIVHRLEEGDVGLNEALEQYEKGVRLLRQCCDLLDRAERRIELLSGVDAEGRPVSTPLDDPSPTPTEKVPGRRPSADDFPRPP